MAALGPKSDRVKTVEPGVGPVVALTYRATVDVLARFRNSKAVGAVFGLTPSRYQSGEINRTGAISRALDIGERRGRMWWHRPLSAAPSGRLDLDASHVGQVLQKACHLVAVGGKDHVARERDARVGSEFHKICAETSVASQQNAEK